MDEQPRGQLLGYLLDALEDDERESLDAALRRDPGLREQLVRTGAGLTPLRSVEPDFDPPPGLARRTCDFVAAFAARAAAQVAARPRPARRRSRQMTAEAVPPLAAPAWSWTDLAAAITVLVMIGLALLPAIQNARHRARLAACQENLHQFGANYLQYAQLHPTVAPRAARPAAPPIDFASLPGGHAPAAGRNVLFDDGRVLLICTGDRLVPGERFFDWSPNGLVPPAPTP